MNELPEIPSDLSTLTDEELAELREQLETWAEENADNVTTADELAQLTQAADAVDAIKAQEAERASEAENIANQTAEALARIKGETENPDEVPGEEETPAEDEPKEGEETPPAEAEPEAVAASATPKRTTRRRPQPAPQALTSLVAAGTEREMELSDLDAALINARRGLKKGEEARVVTITAAADQFPTLTGDEVQNGVEIEKAVRARTDALTAAVYAKTAEERQEALVAAGGICAPEQGVYDQVTLGEASRPVADSLVRFNAGRGAIRWQAPPSLADIDISGAGAAVDIRTEAQDADALNNLKTCQVITCGSDASAVIQAIYSCLEFGNLTDRTFPELVAAWRRLAAVAQARLAETAVLDAISTGSTAVTHATGDTGAARELLALFAQASAGFRSRHRMGATDVLELQLPFWVKNLVVADFARTLDGDLALGAFGRWEAAVRELGLAVNYYLDTETSGGMQFAAQTAAALLAFPTTVKAYMYAPGTFMFLDGGTLDLGVVRDSTLNTRNSFQIFAETFEQVAKVGPQSLELTFTVSPTGGYAAAVTSAPNA